MERFRRFRVLRGAGAAYRADSDDFERAWRGYQRQHPSLPGQLDLF